MKQTYAVTHQDRVRIKEAILISHNSVFRHYISASCLVTILTDAQASTEREYINRDLIKETIQCISSAITQGLAR